jgi:hypothetical protein
MAGKKSVESLSIATIAILTRPKAPKDLNKNQRKIWDDVTKTKPPAWFESDCFPLLRAYCIAANRHDKISKEIELRSISDPDVKGLMDMEEKQARLLATLGTKMRLTQQSRYTPQAASTANKKAASGKAPWET